MRSHLALAVTFALLLLAASPAAASPISYSFTGTLNNPFNGSREFRGTVTFNSKPTEYISTGNTWARVSQYADMTLNAGGHTIEMLSQDPRSAMHNMYVGVSPTWLSDPTGPRQDEIMFLGSVALNLPALGGANFAIMSYTPSSSQDLADLRTLNFEPGTSTATLRYDADGQFYNGTGTITSFTPIATPEPSTWLVALIAGGAAALRLRRSA
ncbi:PEP-CTERM sorting domain-containing protein [Paludisphaera rhizosphaerae]|uniref:PEP-CTERM sorting domain-containing protein n=1 Tax=Paludisphaera rhizosphaerae TaxID=2711216 RepID=UPI0013E9DDD7|nr:PEP-CTERM sorting domain-containing protein [Paludisphaera rhizosphaerae]